jgi:hypothetical protein
VLQPKLIIVGFVLLALASSALLMAATYDRKPKLSSAVLAAPPPQSAPEFKQRLDVYLHRNEIRPKLIRAWPGKAVLTIQTETMADTTLNVVRAGERRTPILSVTISPGRMEREVNLVAGEYLIYQSSNPNVYSRLIVEPRQ